MSEKHETKRAFEVLTVAGSNVLKVFVIYDTVSAEVWGNGVVSVLSTLEEARRLTAEHQGVGISGYVIYEFAVDVWTDPIRHEAKGPS